MPRTEKELHQRIENVLCELMNASWVPALPAFTEPNERRVEVILDEGLEAMADLRAMRKPWEED
jgi:hypothetical protein